MTAVEATSVTEEEQSKPLALRVGAELVGSFIICFAIYSICTLGSAIYGVNMAFIALLTGLVYAAATLIFGTISGAQFNPAVSVAAMLSGKTHVLDGVLYIIAQVLGGIGAGAAIRFLLPTSEQVTLKIWLTPVINGLTRIPSPMPRSATMACPSASLWPSPLNSSRASSSSPPRSTPPVNPERPIPAMPSPWVSPTVSAPQSPIR
mgnify:CR=1 FL=1